MKLKSKNVVCIIPIVVCIIHLFMFSLSVFPSIKASAEVDSAEDKLNENILDQIDNLDLKELEAYVQSLGDFDDAGIGERLFSFIKGENFDYAHFSTQFIDVLLDKVLAIIPAFSCVCAIALLSSIMSALKGEGTGKTSMEMIFLVCYVAVLIPLILILTQCFSATKDCINDMQRQMQMVFPLMLTLIAASGGGVSVGVARPAVAFFSTTIVAIMQNIVLPITMIMIAFSIAGNLSKGLKIGKFTSFFKGINKWVIGICISVFGIFFTMQGITSSSYDGIVRRVAKYAIGNGIPIIGGFLSGGYDVAIAGSVLIKNALGSMSIFLLLFVLFDPFILILSVIFLLRFTSAVTQPLGDSRISNFLSEIADHLQYCMASLLATAFMYFLSILILICATESIL